MTAGEKYVAAAYLVVFAAVLVYLVIIAAKVARLERELDKLLELLRRRRVGEHQVSERDQVPVA